MHTREAVRGGAAIAHAVRELYGQGQTDYSLEPVVAVDEQGCHVGRIRSGDAVVFCCRRGEREVQLAEAFADPGFDKFPRPQLRDVDFVMLTLYHDKFRDLPVAFAPARLAGTLAEVISRAGMRQAHIAESEKFAHVTFFFNGGNNRPFAGEDDFRVPSPHGVAFDQAPELSLAQVVDEVRLAIHRQYDFIVANFANGDVIGHTSNSDAKLRCASLVDAALGRVLDAAIEGDYVLLVTADHGNLELMRNADGTPHVAHTSNPVAFVMVDGRSHGVTCAHDGVLADVAPTVLSALGLDPALPPGIETLVPRHNWEGRRRVLLLILDGWGIGREDGTNPIYLAATPRWDGLLHRYPHSRLLASGEAVGLVAGKPGNSEAGHMNIGAGRVVPQDDVRLDLAMRDGSFEENEVLLAAIRGARERHGDLHLIGLLSHKSSHGTIEYPLAVLRMARGAGLARVFLHLIFDGRSTDPGTAPLLLEQAEARVREIGLGEIVTGVGRGIALDRNGDYGKTRRAYDALVSGVGKPAPIG